MPHHLPLRLRKRPALGVLVGLWLAVGCVTSASDRKASSAPPSDGLDASGVVIQDGQVVDGRDAPLEVPTINPLCGSVSIDCGPDNTPDDTTACSAFDGGNVVGAGGTSSGAGGAGNAGTTSGSGGLGALADASPVKTTLDGGTPLIGALTLPTAVGTFDAGPAYACQVVSADNGLPVRRCLKAGTGTVGAPCSGSTDCQAGLACVGTQGAGQCRPYCCEPGTVCGVEPSDQDGGHGVVTYCGERPLLEGSAKTSSLSVPVCVPADGCRLEEPYPCTTGNCTCPTGTACTIVGSGTTSCVKPGAGTLSDPCGPSAPCGWGYFCSQSTLTCVKICRTSATDSACSPGVCQATAGFPDGFGLCVGPAPTLK